MKATFPWPLAHLHILSRLNQSKHTSHFATDCLEDTRSFGHTISSAFLYEELSVWISIDVHIALQIPAFVVGLHHRSGFV